jgi:hypothetical protein
MYCQGTACMAGSLLTVRTVTVLTNDMWTLWRRIKSNTMTNNLKARIEILGSHFDEKKSRDELYSIINQWLHRRKDTECEI